MVQPKVSASTNQELLLPFTNEEIKFALFQMHPTKALGPDGMSSSFYQKDWEVVGHDVCNGVRHILTFDQMLRKINFTHLTFVPKTKDHSMMSQLKPISLCKVINKICSKVLTNRLK